MEVKSPDDNRVSTYPRGRAPLIKGPGRHIWFDWIVEEDPSASYLANWREMSNAALCLEQGDNNFALSEVAV